MIISFIQLLAETTTVKDEEPILQIILAVITVLGLTVTGYFGYKGAVNSKTAAVESTQANQAVNHRGGDQDRLFDMVAQTRDQVRELMEWRKTWEDLPDQISSAEALAAQFRVIDDRIISTTDAVSRSVGRLDERNILEHSKFNARLDALQERVMKHIDWEENQKYVDIEGKIREVSEKLTPIVEQETKPATRRTRTK